VAIRRRAAKVDGKKEKNVRRSPMEHESSIYTGYYFPRDARTWAEWKKPWGADVPEEQRCRWLLSFTRWGANTRGCRRATAMVLAPSRPLIEPDVLFPALTSRWFSTAAYYPLLSLSPFFPHCLRVSSGQQPTFSRIADVTWVWWKRYDASIKVEKEKMMRKIEIKNGINLQ